LKNGRVELTTLPKCDVCPLKGRPVVSGYGNTDRPEIAFVAEAPGKTEAEQGRPLVGRSGQFLRRVLGDLGINPKVCYFTNACLCRPAGNAPPKAAAVKACRGRLVEELARIQPNMIVVLGKTAASLVGHLQAIGRSRGVYREVELRASRASGVKPHIVGVIPTYHPAGVLRGPERFPDFVEDLEYVQSILAGEPPVVEPPYENYVYVRDQLQFDGFLGLLSQQTLVAVDLETDKMDWVEARIMCAGFSWERERAWVVDWEELLEQNHQNLRALNEALRTVALVFHNGVYDVPFMLRAGLTNTNYYLDTLCAHYLLDERQGTHSLERLAIKYYRAPDYKQQFREDIGLGRQFVDDAKFATLVTAASKETLFDYNGADTDYTYRLAIDLVEKVEEEGCLEVLKNIEMPAARTFVDFSMTGMLIDRDYLEKMGQSWSTEEIELVAQMKDEVGDPDFNPNSPKQLARYMFDELGLLPFGGKPEPGTLKIDENLISKDILTVTGDPEAREYWTSRRTIISSGMKGFGGSVKGLSPRSTSAYMLYWLRQQHYFPNLVLRWRYLRKRRSLYYDGLKEHMGADGRVHPRYVLAATLTGRKSTSKPAIHNIPRGDVVYNLFCAEPGWCLIHADYAQGEMRMMAHYSQDKVLIHLLETTDIHTAMARQIFHLTDEDVAAMSKDELSDKRIAAKILTFGIPYGRSASGLAPQLGITREEAQQYIKDYFALIPGLHKWLIRQRARGVDEQEITSVFGRRRRFPLITDQYHRREVERMAGNMAIQSGVNDLTLLGYVHSLENMRKEGIPAKPGPHIHDSVNFTVPKTMWCRAVEIISETMAHVPFETNVSFPADVEVGDHWGGMVTVHKRGQWVEPDTESELPDWILRRPRIKATKRLT